jgi:hypothetical protein
MNVCDEFVNGRLHRTRPSYPSAVSTGSDSAVDGVQLVVRIWLPDRPGALGLVASRIGGIGADIVSVDVLERSTQVAVDEFAVILPNEELIGLLVREIEEVDGASVEEYAIVDRFPDPRLDALATVGQITCAVNKTDAAVRLVEGVYDEFNASWTVLLSGEEIVAKAGGQAPGASVLAALAAGTSASPAVAAGEGGPEDLAVAPLSDRKAMLLVGRDGHPFRRRERRQLLALAGFADRLLTILP